jgi:hypothetical protein
MPTSDDIFIQRKIASYFGDNLLNSRFRGRHRMKEGVYICVNCPTRDTGTLVIYRALLLHVWTNQRGVSQCMAWLGLRGRKLKRNRRFRLRVGTTVGARRLYL